MDDQDPVEPQNRGQADQPTIGRDGLLFGQRREPELRCVRGVEGAAQRICADHHHQGHCKSAQENITLRPKQATVPSRDQHHAQGQGRDQ